MNTLQNSAATWSPNLIDEGVTTIVWGTSGLLSNYIVTTANESQRTEEIDIEQGDGFEAIVIILVKGVDLELEVVDDTAVTPPAIGQVVTFSTPFGSIPMLTVGSKASQQRKREGMRTLNFRSYNAIAGLH